MFRVIWDIRHGPITFDFAVFLAIAECQRQLTHPNEKMAITIRTGAFRNESTRDEVMGQPEKEWRIQNIILGMCQLLPSIESVSVTPDPQGDFDFPEDPSKPPYHNRQLAELYRKGANALVYRAPEFAKALTKVSGPYVTLTLRTSRYFTQRNVDLRAWHKFYTYLASKKIQVIVIPDQEDVLSHQNYAQFQWPIYFPAALDLRLRLALYEGAIVNIGSGGVYTIGTMAECPMILFDQMRGNPYPAQYLEAVNGFPPGGQYPWCRSDQVAVWKDSNYQSLKDEWDRQMSAVSVR